MSQSLQLTNNEILRAVAQIAGVSRNVADWAADATTASDIREVVRSGLRRFYNPVPVDGPAHQWRFLERKFVASYAAAYATGTLAVTGGVATLTGGTFPTWAADGIIQVDGHPLFVTVRTDGVTCGVMNDTLVLPSGTAYTLYRYRYPLPTDFSDFVGGVAYIHPSWGRKLRNVMDTEIALRYAANFRTGQTSMYAVVPKSGNDLSDWYFNFWPTFDDGASIVATYRTMPLDNLDPTDLTQGPTVVQINPVHAETMLAAIQAAAEEFYGGGPSVHSARYPSCLAASIALDKQSQGAIDFNDGDGQRGRDFYLLNHVPDYTDLL